MIIFAATGWLWAAGVAGVVGGWALWRGQRRQRGVPSIRLWRGLGQAAGTTRSRVVDPLWGLVLLAGILAALALAGPQWRRAGRDTPMPLSVEWKVRSIRNPPAEEPPRVEAWIRVPDAERAKVDVLRINGTARPVSSAELHAGITAEISGNRVELALEAAGKPAATAVFEKPSADAPSFGLLRLTGSGGAIDHDLDRLFSMQPGAHPDDPALQPCVALIKAVKLNTEELAGANLVIAEPDAELPGIIPGVRVSAAGSPEGWTSEPVVGGNFAWPRFVSLKDVHVKALREAQFSAEWQIIARVNGKPWIAVRTDHGLWIWLASEPATEADWSRAGAGFVTFFAEMQARAFGKSSPLPFLQWTAKGAPKPESTPITPLTGYAGAASILLLVISSAWHMARRGAAFRRVQA